MLVLLQLLSYTTVAVAVAFVTAVSAGFFHDMQQTESARACCVDIDVFAVAATAVIIFIVFAAAVVDYFC